MSWWVWPLAYLVVGLVVTWVAGWLFDPVEDEERSLVVGACLLWPILAIMLGGELIAIAIMAVYRLGGRSKRSQRALAAAVEAADQLLEREGVLPRS